MLTDSQQTERKTTQLKPEELLEILNSTREAYLEQTDIEITCDKPQMKQHQLLKPKPGLHSSCKI